MSTDITTSLDWTRQIQSLEETVPGVVDLDGTWKNIGISTRFTKRIGKEHEEIGLLGKEDIHDDADLFNDNSFALTWLLFDTRFLRYCTELRGGTGTIGKTNSLMQTMLVNGVQKTRLIRGALCERVTIDAGKLPRVTANFKCLSQSNWLDDAALEAEIQTVAWVPAPAITSKPWTHKSSGTLTPFTYGAGARDLMAMSVDINRNPAIKDPLGHSDPKSIRAGGRRISSNVTVWLEDDVIMDDVQNMTGKNLVLRLHSTPVDLTLTSFKPNDYTQDNDVNSFDALTEPITGTCTSVSVSPLTIVS